MRLFSIILFSASLAVAAWWLWENQPNIREIVEQYIENGEFQTLEARYTADQIMETNRNELLNDGARTYRTPELKFHPYLLMEVKYTQADKKTREGVILWGMVDGEMVLDTLTWEKTHGFEDTILANADRNDFKILNAIAKHKDKISIEQLEKELHVERETLAPWLESVKNKHLVVQRGTELQLHFQNPRILVTPQTKINQWLVTKPYNHAQRISKKYSSSQIEKNAKAAFGHEFMVRSVSEIFLPVYSIEVENPDGSILTSFWNALNGQRIAPKYFVSS
jgi:hypothetical protein